MAIQLYINGVDKSNLILWPSLQWSENLNSEVDIVTFEIHNFAGRTYTPSQSDEVTLYDGGIKVFGGNIVKIDRQIRGYDDAISRITVKDYTHAMDRLLVGETFEDTPLINILCEILNKYINKKLRVEIATFDTNEIWSGGSADTENYRTGTQGRKLTSNGSNVTMSRTIFLDLTQNSLGNSDYIDVDVYVDDITKLQSVTIKLGDTTLTNYFSKDVTSQITKNGWNLCHILKSSFSSTGSPNWASINFIQLEADSTGGDTVNVTFSNMQAISANAYTRNNAELATQIVKFIRFNYEYPSRCFQQLADLFQWKWYVDQNRDIHFFAIYGELAAFNLDDTSGKYVYRSLQISENTDQLRNSIYVFGGDYLDSSVTEDLRHQIDGNNKIFKVGYKYDLNTVTLTQNSIEKAVGTDNIEAYTDNEGITQKSNGTSLLNVGDVSGNTYQSMQVIAAKKGRRVKFKIRIKKVGSPSDNFQIQIFSDNGSNQPSASSLSTVATLAGSLIDTSISEKTFTLTEASSNSLLLTKNTKYHVRASRSGAIDGSNYYQIDVYSKVYDGIAATGNSTPVWTQNAYSWFFIEVLGYDALYSIDQRTLVLQTNPSIGDTLSLAGQPLKPVFIQYKENVSIETYGEYQFKINDLSILSKEGARQRALQEVLAWAYQVTEASFETYSSGLKVGATINVQSAIRNIDTDFLISKITANARSNDSFQYSVNLVTTKTFGILYWLQKQILDDDKNIVIDETKILDKLEGFNESVSVVDTNVSSTLFSGKVWSNDAGTTPNALVWSGGVAHTWV